MSAEVRYRPELDGLRAIAVGLVILGHAQWPWAHNGADAGVTAFFVLSGYLITGILARERDRTGRIRLGAFYKRRIIRLGPALLGLLAFTLLLGVAGVLSSHWQLGLASCLAYVSNWVQAAGTPIHPLGHTWSLAIEEQFYLLWPAAVALAWRRALPIALAAIAIGVIARLATSGLFEYFSTITRVDALALGCVIALLRPRWPAWVAAAGAIALPVSGMVLAPEAHDLAIPVAMLATTAVIGGEYRPLARLAPLGLRAYSLYLWNTPMTLLFGSVAFLGPLMTFLVAELSYRLLEVPVLRRGGSRPAGMFGVPRPVTVPVPAEVP
jgi:peptidoglycan/LPS O-acetylase OafA/YrhL